ncbi:MAG: sigma-70 family RNA polymerase sigma factor [Flavobacteriaceae bacterium]|jgi:RNA polymerase sigma-70 factor (ECF subfamily)|nr:sigma-70 family RNA polymerase sigma factor [Flavobacteriaceae bacterium]
MQQTPKHILQPLSWVELHADYLFNYAFPRLNDEELAKDVVQETFFAGLKGVENFKGEASERTWLVSILKRKIIDHYRKMNSAKGKAEVKVNFYEDGDKKGNWLEERVPHAWDNLAERDIENDELKKVLEACIENLPDKQKMVFLMKQVQHYETDEICKELDITPSNLWVIIHRARHQLRKCLEDNWFAK